MFALIRSLFFPPVLAGSDIRVSVIDAIFSVNDWVPVINLETVPLKGFQCLVNSFLRRKGVPRGDGSILEVCEIQWVFLARVSCGVGLIVGVKNPARTWLSAHVKVEIPSRVQGLCWLNPPADVAQPSYRIGADDVEADVVDALWEGPVLGAGAGVFAGPVGHGCLPLGVPITKVPFHFKRCDNLRLGRTWSGLPKTGIGTCQ